MALPTPLRVVQGGRGVGTSNRVLVDQATVDELAIEAAVARDERIAHTATVRRHIRAAMRALSEARYGLAGTWMSELERLNEHEAVRARAIDARPQLCGCAQTGPGHGRAAAEAA